MGINPTPIKSIQTKIYDFSWILKAYCNSLEKRLKNKQITKEYSELEDIFVLNSHNFVQLRDPVCKKHLIRLSKNGVNERKIFTADGWVLRNLKLQRYRCKKCGEYKLNHGDFIPRLSNYQEKIKARAIHLFFLGTTPPRIVKIFRLFYKFAPSESSIRNWVRETYEPIKNVVENTTLPVSGYFGYDEIHTRTNGNRTYVFTLVDLWDGFYVNAQFSPDRDNGSIKRFLSSAKHKGKIKLKGLVMDGSNTYGGIFKSWRYNYIKVQRCQTHYKKNLNEAIYKAAGLGMKLKIELPEPYNELKKALFGVFNRSTLFRAELQLVIAENRFYGKLSKEVDKIIDHFYKLSPNLFRYLTNHRLKHTNNAVERMNLDLERYPSLKTRMKTVNGVNLVVKGIVFLHNYVAFQKYITKNEYRISVLGKKIALFPEDEELKSLMHGLVVHLRWVKKYYSNYQEIYNRYFKLSNKDNI